MKKTLALLILILVAVFAVLSIFARDEEYSAEKLFYRAMKTSREIAVNPEVVPPAMLASLEKDFWAIVNKYPHTKSAKGARIALAEFYISYKRYDEALAMLDTILNIEDEEASVLSRSSWTSMAMEIVKS